MPCGDGRGCFYADGMAGHVVPVPRLTCPACVSFVRTECTVRSAEITDLLLIINNI